MAHAAVLHRVGHDAIHVLGAGRIRGGAAQRDRLDHPGRPPSGVHDPQLLLLAEVAVPGHRFAAHHHRVRIGHDERAPPLAEADPAPAAEPRRVTGVQDDQPAAVAEGSPAVPVHRSRVLRLPRRAPAVRERYLRLRRGFLIEIVRRDARGGPAHCREREHPRRHAHRPRGAAPATARAVEQALHPRDELRAVLRHAGYGCELRPGLHPRRDLGEAPRQRDAAVGPVRRPVVTQVLGDLLESPPGQPVQRLHEQHALDHRGRQQPRGIAPHEVKQLVRQHRALSRRIEGTHPRREADLRGSEGDRPAQAGTYRHAHRAAQSGRRTELRERRHERAAFHRPPRTQPAPQP